MLKGKEFFFKKVVSMKENHYIVIIPVNGGLSKKDLVIYQVFFY
jgi:hypothetical protein